jgi:hypothetical protein
LIFGLFRKNNKTFFWFVSVFWIRFETTETNKSVSKQTKKYEEKKTSLVYTVRQKVPLKEVL